jgi:hypothetical protein
VAGWRSELLVDRQPVIHTMKDSITLISDYKLAQELSQRLDANITPRSIALWRRSGKIPYVKLGYRTLRYDLDKVLAALTKREIKAGR